MLFYFAGTGNSEWVAKEIAKCTNDVAYDIAKIKKVLNLSQEKQVGFVFPIYAWGVSEPMVQFAKQLERSSAYTASAIQLKNGRPVWKKTCYQCLRCILAICT